MSFNISTLNSIFWILLMVGIGGTILLVLKKVPVVLAAPEESLTNKETFFEFISQMIKNVPHKLRGWEITVLEKFTKNLFKFKILSLKAHNKIHYLTEIINKRLHKNRMIVSARNGGEKKSEETSQSSQETKE